MLRRSVKQCFVGVTGFVAGMLFVNAVSSVFAAPTDIRGAAGVAVDTFQNQSSTFTLFSDGHIEDRKSSPHAPLPPDSYTNTTQFPAITPTGIYGAPKVAVKAITTSNGTFVQFADGNVKTPTDPYYAAPEAAPSKIIRGSVAANGSITGGSGFQVRIVNGSPPGTYYITYNSPFTSVPSFTVTCDDGATGPHGGGGTPLVVAIMQSYSETGFQVQLQGYTGSNGFQSAYNSFHFVALGD